MNILFHRTHFRTLACAAALLVASTQTARAEPSQETPSGGGEPTPDLGQPAPDSGGEAPPAGSARPPAGDATPPASEGGTTDKEAEQRAGAQKLIDACRQRPNHDVCIKLRNGCEAKRGQWEGVLKYLCPGLLESSGGEDSGGGGGGGGGSGVSGLGAKLKRICDAGPSHPDYQYCRQVTQACETRYDQLKPEAQQLCHDLDLGPKKEPPPALFQHIALSFLKYGDSAKLGGNSMAFGGQVSMRTFNSESPTGMLIDMHLGKATSGWHYDAAIGYGLGGWFGKRFAIGVYGGGRLYGITGGGLPVGLSAIADVSVQIPVAKIATLLVYARPGWHLGEDNGPHKRKGGATIGAFADEFQLGVLASLAKLKSAKDTPGIGLTAGLLYHEWLGSRFLGISAGFGVLSHD